MSLSQTISDLELFIEKSEKLESSSFVASLMQNAGASMSWKKGGPVVIERRGPNSDSIEAFVLTIRFFIQDNEPISLRKMKSFFHSGYVDSTEKEKFDSVRSNLREYLDGNTMLNLDGHIIKRGELLDVYIYGGLSHANRKKKKIFDSWMNNSMVVPILTMEFTTILHNVLHTVVFVKNLAQTALVRLHAEQLRLTNTQRQN